MKPIQGGDQAPDLFAIVPAKGESAEQGFDRALAAALHAVPPVLQAPPAPASPVPPSPVPPPLVPPPPAAAPPDPIFTCTTASPLPLRMQEVPVPEQFLPGEAPQPDAPAGGMTRAPHSPLYSVAPVPRAGPTPSPAPAPTSVPNPKGPVADRPVVDRPVMDPPNLAQPAPGPPAGEQPVVPALPPAPEPSARAESDAPPAEPAAEPAVEPAAEPAKVIMAAYAVLVHAAVAARSAAPVSSTEEAGPSSRSRAEQRAQVELPRAAPLSDQVRAAAKQALPNRPEPGHDPDPAAALPGPARETGRIQVPASPAPLPGSSAEPAPGPASAEPAERIPRVIAALIEAAEQESPERPAVFRRADPAAEPTAPGAPMLTAPETSRPADAPGGAARPEPVRLPQEPANRPATMDRVTVHLPPEAGGARVQIAVRGDVVHARIVAPDEAGGRELERGLGELRGALERHGFQESRLQVEVARSAEPAAGAAAGREAAPAGDPQRPEQQAQERRHRDRPAEDPRPDPREQQQRGRQHARRGRERE